MAALFTFCPDTFESEREGAYLLPVFFGPHILSRMSRRVSPLRDPPFLNVLPKDGEALYFPGIFSEGECAELFSTLETEIQCAHESIRLFGKWILQPRLTALYGEDQARYRYSGIEMKAAPWTLSLRKILERIEPIAGARFSIVLLNFYRNERDSMGWHSDNERELGTDPVIASVSFGVTRRFSFRHRTERKLRTSIDLEAGSLLLMRGKSQEAWQHAIPKETRSLGPRINLTFRILKP